MSDIFYTYRATTIVLVTAGLCAVAIAFFAAIVLAPFETSDDSYIKTVRKIFQALIGYSIPISILAYVAGYLTVYSRTSAVGNVLPAVLALVGGANIYVFGTDNSKKGIVGYCVLLFASMIFLGTQDGALHREREIGSPVCGSWLLKNCKFGSFERTWGLTPIRRLGFYQQSRNRGYGGLVSWVKGTR